MPPLILLLFGATGDLARRKLYKALLSLFEEGFLKRQSILVVGLGRKEMTDRAFQEIVAKAIGSGPEESANFLGIFRYQQLDTESTGDAVRLGERVRDLANGRFRSVFSYLSLDPANFPSAVDALEIAGLNQPLKEGGAAWIALEKPLGHDLAQAFAIHERVKELFGQNRFYVDHYLGKGYVDRVIELVRDPRILGPERLLGLNALTLVSQESVGSENRTYFLNTGIARDMFGHLLVIAGEILRDHRLQTNPSRYEWYDELRTLSPSRLAKRALRAQYITPNIPGDNIVEFPNCETFAAVTFGNQLMSPRRPLLLTLAAQKGAPAKKLRVKFGFDDGSAVVVTLDPNFAVHHFTAPTDTGKPYEIGLTKEALGEGYPKILRGFLGGDRTASMRFSQIEFGEQNIVSPVSALFSANSISMRRYNFGTDRPLQWLDEICPGSSRHL